MKHNCNAQKVRINEKQNIYFIISKPGASTPPKNIHFLQTYSNLICYLKVYYVLKALN